MIFLYIIIWVLIVYFSYLLIIIFFPVLKSEKIPFDKKAESKTAPSLREDVYFLSGNYKIYGWYYIPEKSEPRSCIIMSHGFNCTKDCLLEDYALEFVKQGHSVLLYDYRGYGESEGEPRQLLSVLMQQEDLQNAIKFTKEIKKIDSIILWGTSAAASYGIILASRDHSIKGVIAQCGAYDHKVDSQKGLKDNGLWFYISLLPHGIRDKWRGRLGLSRHIIPAYGKSGSKTFLRGDSIFNGVAKLAQNSKNFKNEVCAAFMLQSHGPDVIEASKSVKCPVLVITCKNDEIISSESHVKLTETLGDKMELITFPIGHFDIYQGEWFKASINKQIEFINRVNSYNLSI